MHTHDDSLLDILVILQLDYGRDVILCGLCNNVVTVVLYFSKIET